MSTERSSLALFALLWGFPLLVAGCGGTNASQSAGPTPVKCQTLLNGIPGSIAASGGSVNATLTTTRECLWEVTTDTAWLQITPGRGQGEASLRVVVAENTAGSSRTGTIAANDARLTIAQQAAPCRFTVNPSSARLPAEGGTVRVSVSAAEGCTWSAASAAQWVRGVTTAGKGNGTAEFSGDGNAGEERATTLKVAGLTVSLVQVGRETPAPPPPAPPSPGPAPNPAPDPIPTPQPAPPTEGVKFKGRVSNLAGVCPVLSFRVDRRPVVTDGRTRFTEGNCRDLRNGMEVEIEGELLADAVVHATKVELKKK
jgi:hypothetical protein